MNFVSHRTDSARSPRQCALAHEYSPICSLSVHEAQDCKICARRCCGTVSVLIVAGRAHPGRSPEAAPLAPSGNRCLDGVFRSERITGQTPRLAVRPVAFGLGLCHHRPRVHRCSENDAQSCSESCKFWCMQATNQSGSVRRLVMAFKSNGYDFCARSFPLHGYVVLDARPC